MVSLDSSTILVFGGSKAVDREEEGGLLISLESMEVRTLRDRFDTLLFWNKTPFLKRQSKDHIMIYFGLREESGSERPIFTEMEVADTMTHKELNG